MCQGPEHSCNLAHRRTPALDELLAGETAELGNPQRPPSPSLNSPGDFTGPEAKGGRRDNAPAVPDRGCARPEAGGGAAESPHRTGADTAHQLRSLSRVLPPALSTPVPPAGLSFLPA
uniref:Uncharacterized protein n=1 Tax=Sphaerodactylus townsendi TaxID=933632 RepID=A0ACB8EJG5_9SAUR